MKNYKSDKIVTHLESNRVIQSLKRTLIDSAPEEQIEILSQISTLLDDKDSSLLLSLAIRSFHLEMDEEAFAFLEKAKKNVANDQNTLRTELFLSAALGHEDSNEICAHLLTEFPNDDWAIEIKKRLDEGDMSSLSLPNVSGDWGLA
jgi:hypothetical protein